MTTVIDPWARSNHDEAQALPAYAADDPARPHDRHAEDDEPSDVDELAVMQVADDGLRLPLRGAERDEAIRRMHGRVELDLIAWRLYTTTRTVHRVAARLRLNQRHTTRGEPLTLPAR